MTENEFSQALRRGLGSAIIEIKNAKDKAKYRDTVLLYCLRDISYDWQVEGTKGKYLYFAICALGDKDYFEKTIIDRFLSRCSDRLFLQISGILLCFAEDGSTLAKEAFRKKYNYFASKQGRLSRNRTLDIDEGVQWDEVADNLFYIDGFSAFMRYAQDAGESLRINPDNHNVYYDWFVNRARDVFGEKRVNNFIDIEESNAIKFLIDTIKADQMSRSSYQLKENKEKITTDMLINVARKAVIDENPRGKIMRFRQFFWKNASETDILALANAALHEEDETVKGLLLRLFWRRPFPLGEAPLLKYTQSNNEILVESVVSILGEMQSSEIHDIAIMLLENKGLDSLALGLLKKNYKKSDDDIIYSLIKKKSSISHHVQQDIGDIYLNHRSINALPTLHNVYKKGICTLCRYRIIKSMNHCRVLSDEILEECQYDSYDETRRFANRLIARRQKNN